MSVPQKSSSLAGNREFVYISLASLDGTLSDIWRPIRPPAPKLSDSMPAILIANHSEKELDFVGFDEKTDNAH